MVIQLYRRKNECIQESTVNRFLSEQYVETDHISKSDTPSSDSGRSGAFGGQGSHFRKDDDQGINPTTVAGTSPQTTATSDITNARGTAGPEAGGSGHVSTASAISTGHSGMDSARDGSSSAAIGQTTTYSSTPLASGDPTGSVIDHGSRDPLTYKKPESGVPSGSAAAAASQAWHSHGKARSTILDLHLLT